jgi:Zn-dependent protease with chaperone function
VFLSLLTESFAVRALLGSAVAVALTGAAVRGRWVRGPRARRLVVLAPVLAAVAAGLASVIEAETYLPQVWVTSAATRSGQVLEFLGELRFIATDRGVDLLVLGWAVVVAVLLTRRVVGLLACRRLVRTATPLADGHPLAVLTARLARRMGGVAVDLRLLADCPGGALTMGTRRPVIIIDPALAQRLDPQEIEGLLAHEIAHVARRDTLLAAIVGVFADVTFFLPTIHLAARWLRREREESADELASDCTGRPGALASSILKVFQGAVPAAPGLTACAAVPAVLGHGRLRRRPAAVSEGAGVVAARVERLVAGPGSITARRDSAEVLLAAAMIVVASAATLVVPSWIATDLGAYSLAFGYVPPPEQPVESAAFATFRALAPVATADDSLMGWERTRMRPLEEASEPAAGCPCIESPAQWLAATPAQAPRPPQRMAWRATRVPTWDVAPQPGAVQARPLLTLPEAEVGFFLVGRTPDR